MWTTSVGVFGHFFMGGWGCGGVRGGAFWVGGGRWTFLMGGWGVGGGIFWMSGDGWTFFMRGGGGLGIFWVDT